MAKYFAPLLRKGTGAFGQQSPKKEKQHSGIIVNMTAKVGSIGDNGWYQSIPQDKSKFFSIYVKNEVWTRYGFRRVNNQATTLRKKSNY